VSSDRPAPSEGAAEVSKRSRHPDGHCVLSICGTLAYTLYKKRARRHDTAEESNTQDPTMDQSKSASSTNVSSDRPTPNERGVEISN